MNTGQLKRNTCQGMALLEVMIAAVVVGIALLGVAAMQVSAMQGASHAHFRSKATDLAASLADRMRANQAGRDTYSSAAANSCDAPAKMCAMACSNKDDMVAGCDAAQLQQPGNCSPNELAVYDLWEVRCLSGVRNTLPNGTLSVTCTETPCTDNTPFQIMIQWQSQHSTDGDKDNTVQDIKLTIIPGGRP